MAPSIEQLVERQVLRWLEEQHESLRSFPSTPPPATEMARPMLCVSRQFGALGGSVGRLVAERLGYDFYGQELVDEIAKQARVRRKIVESLDERLQTGIQQWVDQLMSLRQFASTDYLRNLSQVVLTLGRHGGSVLIGRGAHLILDPETTLRVRCYAPLDWRVEQAAARHDLSHDAARALLQRVDGERDAFYRSHFNTDVSDPEHFDLLLNTATTPLEACARVIGEMLESRWPAAIPTAPKSQVRATRAPVAGKTRAAV